MTNEELAYKIAKKHYRSARQLTDSQKECYDSALEMARWKEQQIIEKACEWLEYNLVSFWQCKFYDDIAFINDFKKAML